MLLDAIPSQDMKNGLQLPTFLSSSIQLTAGVRLLQIMRINSTLSGLLLCPTCASPSCIVVFCQIHTKCLLTKNVLMTAVAKHLLSPTGVLVNSGGATAAITIPDVPSCGSVVHIVESLLLPAPAAGGTFQPSFGAIIGSLHAAAGAVRAASERQNEMTCLSLGLQLCRGNPAFNF